MICYIKSKFRRISHSSNTKIGTEDCHNLFKLLDNLNWLEKEKYCNPI